MCDEFIGAIVFIALYSPIGVHPLLSVFHRFFTIQHSSVCVLVEFIYDQLLADVHKQQIIIIQFQHLFTVTMTTNKKNNVKATKKNHSTKIKIPRNNLPKKIKRSTLTIIFDVFPFVVVM